MKALYSRALHLLAALSLALASTVSAQMIDYTWTGATSGNMSVAGNWSTNVVPPAAITSHMIFTGAGETSLFLGNARNVGQVTFTDTMDTDMSIRFANTATTGNRNWNFTGNATQNASITVQAGATGNIDLGVADAPGSLVISGGSQLLVNHAGSGELTFSRPIAVAATTTAGVTITGGGNVTFSANNTYNGTTTVDSGRLLLKETSSILNSTTVNINNGGTLRIEGAGNRLATNTALTINAGGTFDFVKNQQIGSLNGAGSITGNASSSFTLTVSEGSYSGGFSGNNGLTKTGDGTLSLSGTNTYIGATQIDGGTLLMNAGSIASTSVIVNNGGTLQIGGVGNRLNTAAALTVNGTFDLRKNQQIGTLNGSGNIIGSAGAFTLTASTGNFTGSFSGDNGLTKTGAGTLFLSGTNTYNGTTSSGVIGNLWFNSGSTNNLGGGLFVDGNSTTNQVVLQTNATFGGTLTGTGGVLISGVNTNLTINQNGNSTFTGTLNGGGSFTKGGDGTLTLAGASSYSGATIIDGGTLLLLNTAASLASNNITVNNSGTLLIGGAGSRLNSNTALIVNAGGTFDLQKNQTIGSLNGAGDVISSGGAFSLTLGSGNFSGNFSGTAGITKNGAATLTLSGTNTYSGNTTVSNGTLVINGSTSSTSLVTVAAGATLGGNGTVGGATTVAGFLAPGNSAGVLAFGDSLKLESTAATTIEIVGLNMARGVDFDGVNVGGELTYGGTLTLDFGVLFETVGSYNFDLFAFTTEGSSGSAFSAVTLAGLYSGSLAESVLGSGVWGLTSGSNTWTFTESTGDLNLTVIPEPRAALLGSLGLLMLLRRRRR